MGANPGSRDSYPGGGAGTGVAGWSPSDRSDVDGINLKNVNKFKMKKGLCGMKVYFGEDELSKKQSRTKGIQQLGGQHFDLFDHLHNSTWTIFYSQHKQKHF